MQCPNCRAENPADHMFCGQCATPLAEHAGGPVRHMDATRLARREIVLIVAVVALLLGGGYASWQFIIGQRGPDAVVRRFIDADMRGDYAALNKFVAPGVDASIVLQVFQHYRRSTGASPFVNCRVQDPVKYASSATVDVEIHPKNSNSPTPLTITFSLSYENGEWKILPSATVASALTALVLTGSHQFATSLSSLLTPSLMQSLSGMIRQGMPSIQVPLGGFGSGSTAPSVPVPVTPSPPKTNGTI